ncbi:MAG: hypothetical protein J5940_05320 [Clostridia bacterium]|nr:hypothetical protein [Clostridia bacterium]
MKKCKKCPFGSKLLKIAAIAMFTPYQITVKDGELETRSLALTMNAKMEPQEDESGKKLDLTFTFFGGNKSVHPMDKMKECCTKITDAVNKAKEKKASCECGCSDETPCGDNAPDSTPEAARNCDEDGVDADESSEAEAEKGADAE